MTYHLTAAEKRANRPRIRSWAHANAHPDRVAVYRRPVFDGHTWGVSRGLRDLATYPTHAAAIAAADRIAREEADRG